MAGDLATNPGSQLELLTDFPVPPYNETVRLDVSIRKLKRYGTLELLFKFARCNNLDSGYGPEIANRLRINDREFSSEAFRYAVTQRLVNKLLFPNPDEKVRVQDYLADICHHALYANSSYSMSRTVVAMCAPIIPERHRDLLLSRIQLEQAQVISRQAFLGSIEILWLTAPLRNTHRNVANDPLLKDVTFEVLEAKLLEEVISTTSTFTTLRALAILKLRAPFFEHAVRRDMVKILKSLDGVAKIVDTEFYMPEPIGTTMMDIALRETIRALGPWARLRRVTRMRDALRRARLEAADRVYKPQGVGAMEAEASFNSARGMC